MRKRKGTLILLVSAIICLILSFIPATQSVTVPFVGSLFRALTIIIVVNVVYGLIVEFRRKK